MMLLTLFSYGNGLSFVRDDMAEVEVSQGPGHYVTGPSGCPPAQCELLFHEDGERSRLLAALVLVPEVPGFPAPLGARKGSGDSAGLCVYHDSFRICLPLC